MDPLRLVACLADDPVPSLQLTGFGHGCVAANAHPEHGQATKAARRRSWDAPPPRKTSSTIRPVPVRAIAASPSYQANSAARKASPTTTDPSARDLERAAGTRVERAMGQRTNEIVDPECQPRPVELRLQARRD